MYRKILIGGMTAAAIVGTGGAALALSGSETTDGTATTTVASVDQPLSGRHPLLDRKALRRIAHGEVVVRGADGFVTHDLIVGTVTSVSSTSITVRAADNTSETFVINSDTKVRMRTIGAGGAASTIDKVATGDHVVVAGTGTSTLTAKHVIDIKK
jgi:hypothetical protein